MTHQRVVLFLTLLLALLVAGCARGATTNTTEGDEVATGDDPIVVIDAPASGTSIPTGQIVEIRSTATGTTSPVQRIEMYINGDLIADDSVPDAAGQPTFSVTQRWVPVEPGRAEVAVYAYNAAGTRSRPASIVLEVGGDAMAPNEPGEETTDPVTDTAPITDTDEPTEEAEPAPDEPTEEAEPSASPEAEDEGEDEGEGGEPTAPADTDIAAVVTAEGGLNVRDGPALDAERVDGVLLGQRVIAIGRTEAGDWIRIRHGEADSEGWVAAEFLDLDGDAATLPVLN